MFNFIDIKYVLCYYDVNFVAVRVNNVNKLKRKDQTYSLEKESAMLFLL